MILMADCKLPDKQAFVDEILRLITENPLLTMSVRDSLSRSTEIDAMIREKVKTQMIEKRALPTVDIDKKTSGVKILAYIDPVNIEIPLNRFSMPTIMDVLQQLKHDELLIRKK